jgi:Flp pilus assembly protein TadD
MTESKTEEIAKLIAQALIFKQEGDLLNAEINLKKVLKYEPDNFIALNNLGNICSLKNDLKNAKFFF